MMLDHALACVEQGWAVFPLVPNTKRPLTKNGFKDASKSAYAVRKWWAEHPDANIGLATGEVSGIVVVDVDVKNGAKGRESLSSLKGLSPTLTVTTPSGGWHLYYLCPQGGLRSKNGLLPGIDLKADGGYVVAPGSVIDSKPYEYIDAEAHISRLSEIVTEVAGRTNGAHPHPAPPAGEQILEGARNAALASIAGTMRRRGLDVDEITAALKAVNTKRCRPPLPDLEVETISASIARYPPESSAPNANEKETSTTDSAEEAMPPGFTDDALALEYTAKHAEDWCYVAAWGHWLNWDGTCWRQEKTLRAFDLSRRICREASARCLKPKIAAKVASASTVAAVERLARADRRHAATAEQWDREPWLLNTSGGVVNLRDGTRRPNERSDCMTKLTAAALARTGQQPARWLSFLDAVTAGDGEMQRYLARMAGYALTGVTTEHALFFLYGNGGNGKSVFVNTLAAVMGDYATNAPMDTFLETRGERHPTDLAGLRGARLVTSIEVEKGRRWAEAKIKSLTGGDKIAARFMRQDFFEYKPQFKLVIAGNNKPAIRDVDEAMRRRIHLVPFTVQFKDKPDKNLSVKLLQESAGILSWAVEGCLEWQRIGLNPPNRVVSATEEYLESEDALGRWIEEECIIDPNAAAATDELFASWKAWTEKWGEYTGTKRRLSDDLAKRGFKQSRFGNDRSRGYQGIAPRGKEIQGDML